MNDKHDKIKMFSFLGEYKIVTDFNNYKDYKHHSG